MRTSKSVVAAIVLLAAFAPFVSAADPPEYLQDLNWRAIGPAVMGGRIDDVAVVEKNPSTAYVATATGGLWKTTNHGTTFKPVFDEQPDLSIGAVAVAQSNPDVVWVGTGEANNRQSSSWGVGVFRSVDAGSTWESVGLADTMHIARVVVHPTNPDTAYVAAVGHLWGPNRERGLYRTTDGGKTWTKCLFVDDDTGCTDVAMDPQSPAVLYAAMYQRRRAAYGFVGAGPGSGLYKSTDAGATWKKLTSGLPAGPLGRIGLDIYRKDPRIVYATVEARTDGGVYRSEDAGETWKKMSGTNPRPMYFSQIRVDPTDDQRLWLGGVNITTSTDGGKSFHTEDGARLHADIHAIWIDPANPNHLLVGCDGGLQWSWDRGRTWDMAATLPLAQFYAVAYDMRQPYWVIGGLQDNGCWTGPSSSPLAEGLNNGVWRNTNGGDGFYCAIDPTDPDTLYCESQNGGIVRTSAATDQSKSIRPRPGPGETAYRFDWDTPFMLSPHNPKELLLGGNRLFISTDRGDSWRRTDDLTTQSNLDNMPIMGQRHTSAGYPFEDIPSSYGQIVTLTESPAEPGVLYVGTDDGNLQVSRDDGKTWKNVVGNLPGVPKGTYVSRVHASPHARGRVYAAFDGHRSNDFHPYVFVSEDYGETWRPIAAGLPEGATVNVIRDHPRTANLLFAGTERGAWVSFDRGGSWTRFAAPLPNARVDDIQIHPRDNDLILATHARGIYILDDIGAFEHVAAAEPAGRFHLLPARPAVAYRASSWMATGGNRSFIGKSATIGAPIRYHIVTPLATGETAEITITARNGKVIRRLPVIASTPGLRRVTWDMRGETPSAPPAPAAPVRPTAAPTRDEPPAQTQPGQPAQPAQPAQPGQPGGRSTGRRTGAVGRGGQPVPGAGGTGGGGGGFFRSMGPRVAPGTYVVHMRVGKEEQTCPIVVEEDPRIAAKPGQLRGYYALLAETSAVAASAQALEGALGRTASAVRSARAAEGLKTAPAPVREAVDALAKDVAALQARAAGTPAPTAAPPDPRTESEPAAQPAPRRGGRFGGLGGRAMMLYSSLDSIAEPPSRALVDQVGQLRGLVGSIDRDLRSIVGRRIPEVNRELAKLKLPTIEVAPEAQPEPPPDFGFPADRGEDEDDG